MIHYNDYSLNTRELLTAILVAGGSLFLIGIIFFKNSWIALLFGLIGLLYPKARRRQLMMKRQAELSMQFKQALYMIASALAAGKSVENALRESHRDLQHLFPDDNAYIRREFKMISNRLDNAESVEVVLQDFSNRTGIEDIQSFSEVFIICKRTGGNLVEVMRNTANIIGEKMAIQQDIATSMAQKKFESRVLSVTPILFVALLSFSSADYMAPLYEGRGRIIMAGALMLLLACYAISRKIMDIRI